MYKGVIAALFNDKTMMFYNASALSGATISKTIKSH